MKTRTKKALAIGVLAPVILVLSACRGEIVYKIEEDGSGSILIEIEDTTGDLTMYGVTCDDIFSEMVTDDLYGITEEDQAEITIEDISGEYLACRMTMTTSENLVDGELLIDNGDTFTFITEADPTADFTDEMPPGIDYEFTVTIEMPGPIIEATNGGEVNGNRVTYDLFESAQTGFEVIANKSGSGTGGGTTGTGGEEPGGVDETSQGVEEPGQGSEDPGADGTPGTGGEEPGEGGDEEPSIDAATGNDGPIDTTDAAESDDEGFPMWAWFAIGGGAVVIIGLVAWMIARGNKNKNQLGPYGPGGYGSGYPPQGGQFQSSQGGNYGQQPPQQNPNQGGQPPQDPNSGQGQWD